MHEEVDFLSISFSKSSIMNDNNQQKTWSVQNGDVAEVKRIFSESGSDVNAKIGSAGRTAAHIAADFGHKHILELLDSMGANLLINFARAMATDDADISPLLYAIFSGHIACVEFLIEKGGDVNGKTPDGETFIEALDNLDISDDKKEKLRKILKQ